MASKYPSRMLKIYEILKIIHAHIMFLYYLNTAQVENKDVLYLKNDLSFPS